MPMHEGPGGVGPVPQGGHGADRRLADAAWAPTTSTSTRSTASTRRPRSRRRWRRCTTWSRPARSATSAPRRCGRGSSPRCSTPPTLHGWTRFISMQDQYSLIQREEEREMFGLLADQGVGSIPWSPLAAGLVARPWGERSTSRGQANPDADPHGRPLFLDSDRAIVDAVQRIAEARGVSMAQVAMAWVLKQPGRRRADRRRHQAAPPHRRRRRARHRRSPTRRSSRSKSRTSRVCPRTSDAPVTVRDLPPHGWRQGILPVGRRPASG